jgi:hypothetical protein
MTAEERETFLGSKEIAYRSTVGLCPPQEIALRPDDASLASGVLVRFRKRTFIVTAAHFLKDVCPSDISVIYAAEFPQRASSVKEGFSDSRRLGMKATPALALKHIGFQESDTTDDVAVIEIDGSDVPRWCSYYDASRRDDEELVKGYLLIMQGFPRAASMQTKRKEPHATTGLPQSTWDRMPVDKHVRVVAVSNPEVVIDPETMKRNFYTERHFAVGYDPDKDKNHLHPKGYSGCGLWKSVLDKTKGGIIQPLPFLVGIEIAYNEKRKYLKVTRMERVVKLLKSYCRDSAH